MGIQAIWSSKLDKYFCDSDGIRSERFNLLIGPNNSGKSRLLRTLFKKGDDDDDSNSNLHIAAGADLSRIVAGIDEIIRFLKRREEIGIFNTKILFDLLDNKCTSCAEGIQTAGAFSRIITAATSSTRLSALYNSEYPSRELSEINELISYNSSEATPSQTAELFRQTYIRLVSAQHHYIPILRGMRPLGSEDDAFRQRTIKDYFPKQQVPAALSIITGFNLYELLVRFLLGQPQDRQRIREYEKILGHEFFGGAEIALIPEYGKDTVSVKIGNDDQFSIFDLGDGMQQVIIITSAAFLAKEPERFFIEEPELCLHPGLLRKLALFLLNHTEHQYFATTHSNHLLDLAEIDTRVTIHKVSKIGSQADVKFEVKESTKDRELLAELGVSASSVYLANCTVWVEGITDRLYLGVFMKQYIDELEDGARKTKLTGLLENFHYAFVEYQGGTLGHWAFDDRTDTEQLNAARLCATAFLLADGDIVGKGDRADLLQQQLGMRLHLLKGKEIENLLPRNIIIETAKALFGRKNKATVQGLDPTLLDKLKADLEVSSHGIGLHLDKALGLKHKGQDARRVFAEESGTIKDKVKFCHAAIEQMNTLEWQLTEPLRVLCEQIFEHILSNNHL